MKKKTANRKQVSGAVPAYKNANLPADATSEGSAIADDAPGKSCADAVHLAEEAANAGGCRGQLRRAEGEGRHSKTAAGLARWAGPAMPAKAKMRARWR